MSAQKAALREQQQALTALVQETTALLALHRERKRLLDDSYRFVLTKMFWLRDGRTMSWAVVEDAVQGTVNVVQRLRVFGSTQ